MDQTDEIPRNYQTFLMEIALEKNTIIYLPTGSGKTFIAVMVLKQLSKDLTRPYSSGGKITFFLVNTVALVDQHAKTLRKATIFEVGCYTGEMDLDGWTKTEWEEEFNKFQVFVMTSQILLNLINNNFIDLERVNLMIFDECHKGVDDHSMRQIMKTFSGYSNPPRILGLTATLLNGNCKLNNIMVEVKALEVSYNSKVATVDGLEDVVGHSTNPQEKFVFSQNPSPSTIVTRSVTLLKETGNVLEQINILDKAVVVSAQISLPEHLLPFTPKSILTDLRRLLVVTAHHIETMGTFGGYYAALAQLVKIERIKMHCDDANMLHVLNYVMSKIGAIKELMRHEWKDFSARDRIIRYSTPKVLVLLDILQKFKQVSNETLCALVFVKQRFTAKVLHHVLEEYRSVEPSCSYIRSNFIVGMNTNHYNETREVSYTNKKNREVLEMFTNKEFNVLFCSNVLEEGIDIPKCTLVVRFDKSEDYRSYVQSKGRARHRKSIFYTIVERGNEDAYKTKYATFQETEQILNEFLIGKNEERVGPSRDAVDGIYHEDELPPYFVNGPYSAQVNMLSAISLLCRYCLTLSNDRYTVYTPNWFLENHKTKNLYRVVIVMPTACPLVKPIEGQFMTQKKKAKRAAALQACIMLHNCGELDDNLLPISRNELGEEIDFLFTHWPKDKEVAGNKSNRRLYKNEVPQALKGTITSDKDLYLHIIELEPEHMQKEIYDALKSNLCFGILTPGALPEVCKFPVFLKTGGIEVDFNFNANIVRLTNAQMDAIRKFHHMIFCDVLEVLRDFLVFDLSGQDSEMMMVVPLDKSKKSIDFHVIAKYQTVNSVQEPTSTEKMNLVVKENEYLHKIVTPWYRNDRRTYIVTKVNTDCNALSPFPHPDYPSFAVYFSQKHAVNIIKRDQPLLTVYPLSGRLNLLKPVGAQAMRKREKYHQEMNVLFIPELVVKQQLPAALWVQARLLPTVLARLAFLAKLHALQTRIARALGAAPPASAPLALDPHLLLYEPAAAKRAHDAVAQLTGAGEQLSLEGGGWRPPHFNKDYKMRMLEAEYAWSTIDEPKDVERDLHVTTFDVEIFESFISQSLTKQSRQLKNESPKRTMEKLAITYPQEPYVECKGLKFLTIKFANQIPNLCDFYAALSTAESNDIVNLERLEILGDSFLKFIASLYIIFKFPKYNEGKATTLKGRLVSNKNLYYLAKRQNLGGVLRSRPLSARDEWAPPGFALPPRWRRAIDAGALSISAIFYAAVPRAEQVSGRVSEQTLALDAGEPPRREDEEARYHSVAGFLNQQYVGDKSVADAVEALIGAFFNVGGVGAAVRLVEWLGLLPLGETETLLASGRLEPVINRNCTLQIDYYLPQWSMIEEKIGYRFSDRNYLLQAFTHPSYTMNRLTASYERLEFVGDAILDFLITCHIYEHCGYLDPGQVTDLRSALVNNVTFASLVVRNNLHKFVLYMNAKLESQITKFVEIMEMKDGVVNDEVLILLEEDDLNMSECIDVPKVLGDIFESIAGAVYLDSGKDLAVVWNVFYKLMWNEINVFSKNVPKNILRRLYECHTAYPKFGAPSQLEESKKTMIRLDFILNGSLKSVYGFGSNKQMAKRAAAKMALRALNL